MSLWDKIGLVAMAFGGILVCGMILALGFGIIGLILDRDREQRRRREAPRDQP